MLYMSILWYGNNKSHTFYPTKHMGLQIGSSTINLIMQFNLLNEYTFMVATLKNNDY